MITLGLLIGLSIPQLTETRIDGKLQRTAYSLTNICPSTVPALILVDYIVQLSSISETLLLFAEQQRLTESDSSRYDINI